MKNKQCPGWLIPAAGALVLIGMILLLHLLVSNRSSFTGNRIKNPNYYSIEFIMMNGQDETTFYLENGDMIGVDYQISKGKLSLSVGMENEAAIYSGNFVDQERFTVVADKTGTFMIRVDAHKAAGYLKIKNKE